MDTAREIEEAKKRLALLEKASECVEKASKRFEDVTRRASQLNEEIRLLRERLTSVTASRLQTFTQALSFSAEKRGIEGRLREGVLSATETQLLHSRRDELGVYLSLFVTACSFFDNDVVAVQTAISEAGAKLRDLEKEDAPPEQWILLYANDG